MDVEDKNGPIINYCAQTFRNGDNVLFAPLFRLRPLYTNAIDLLCFVPVSHSLALFHSRCIVYALLEYIYLATSFRRKSLIISLTSLEL